MNLKIRTKITLFIIVLVVITALIILIFNIVLFSRNVDTSFESRLNVAMTVTLEKIESLKSEMKTSSQYIASNTAVAEAMESGDHDALLNASIALFRETGATFCTITDTSGIAIARPHNPGALGDSVIAMPSVASAVSGRPLTTVEPGATVRMSICSGTPVYNERGEVLGAVVAGYRLDTDDFVDMLKRVLNCEITFFLEDERVATTVTQDDGSRALGTKASPEISRHVLAGNKFVGQSKVLEKDAMVEYAPLLGVDGRPIGMIFTGMYLDEKIEVRRDFIMYGSLVALIILVIGVALSLSITKKIINPLQVLTDFLFKASSTGDIRLKQEDIDKITKFSQTNDEIGQTIKGFDSFIRHVTNIADELEAVASGDLTTEVEVLSDTDTMGNALNHMSVSLNRMFGQINDASVQVSSGAKQIADGAQSLAQGSTQQSASIAELSVAIAEVAGKTTSNAEMATKAASLAKTIKDNAEKGSRQMDEMMTAVNDINDASSQISKVIKVIDDIAFQTNILALNAAVEAARAGQHGKGFAVVAEEVRNLAAKSAEAAKDTGNLIENSIEKANLGVRIAGETAESLTDIVAGINDSNQIVGEIATSSEEQSLSISQLNAGIDQVAQVVHQISALSEESAAASQEMSSQSAMLENLIMQFKLKDGGGVRRSLPVAGNSAKRRHNMPNNTGFTPPDIKSDGFGKY